MSTENAPLEFTAEEKRFYLMFFQRRPNVTIALIVINIIFFLLLIYASPLHVRALQVGSDFGTLINFGAKSNYFILVQHQWFRLLTPVFLHIGIMHVGLNLYSLWQVGPVVERLFGSARFFILYLLAGICGTLASVMGSLISKQDSLSAGASGAIFGLFGAMLVFAYKYRQELPAQFRRGISTGMINVIAINLLFGFINNYGNAKGNGGPLLQHYIDNWGHIGGLLGGMLATLIVPRHLGTEKPLPRTEKILLLICSLLVAFCFIRAYQLRPFLSAR